jgi:sugar lactone lactonase YvrE
MKIHHAALAALTSLCSAAAQAHDGGPFGLPNNAGFTTLVSTPLAIEGLTGDSSKTNLYTTGRSPGAGLPCPVWRVALSSVTPVLVGNVPAPGAAAACNPSGITFGSNGALYVSDGDKVYTLKPDAAAPPTATVYASGVTGTNGLAFDRHGNLWTGDGTTGLGRVWQITPAGVVTEVLRVPPMANAAGVGRSALTLPTGTAQPLVANGIAFTPGGDMLIADTARGALWRVDFDRQGKLRSPLGCDTTYTANTLCWSNVWIAHPLLEGVDGIALDRAGQVFAAANERNALVVVTAFGRVVDLYRSPVVAATGLRNAGALEFPTSPFLLGDLLCTANSDGNRRDNSPNTAGELGGPGQPRGKITCLDRRLNISGLPLPVSGSGHGH